MKLAPFSVLLACAALLGLAAPSARALNPALFNNGFAPLTPLVTQFFLDLEAIPAGSVVTDAQHATLVADLAALPPGGEAPSAADLDALASDFGALAVAGLVDDNLEYNLAMDFDVDYPDPDPWLDDVWPEVNFALHPPTYDPTLDDPTLPYQTVGPADVDPQILIDLRGDVPIPTSFITRYSTDLAPTYYDAPGQVSPAYSGTVRVKTYHFRGVQSSSTILFSTAGLPLNDTYTLSAVRTSDGASVVIGRFRAHGSGQPLPTPLFASTRDLAASGYQVGRPLIDSRSSTAFGGNSKRLLPTGFNPVDFTRVKVTDSQGRVVLTRKFSSPKARTGEVRRTTVSLSGGSISNEATGFTRALYKTALGQDTRSTFHFSARQLPANATLTLTVDGVALGQYVTTSDRRLVIEQGLPTRTTTPSGKPVTVNPLQSDRTDFSTMKSVSLTDAQGTVLLTGGF